MVHRKVNIDCKNLNFRQNLQGFFFQEAKTWHSRQRLNMDDDDDDTFIKVSKLY